jgi:D-alanyl-D-alanine carboxypeptidase
MLLPLIATEKPLVNVLQSDEAALAALREIVPEAAVPAFERMLDSPVTVGLAAYQVGQETEGAYLNADAPMPLASVVKIIHLVAYVEAVVQGRLDPNSVIPLEELNKYYLPGLDLGAHNTALRELEETERILPNPPSVRLEEVPWMMISHSSNAATDYLHFLLGQETIEQTAIALGLSSQTAPCPFLGQFLIMNNHTRQGTSNSSAILGYLDDPVRYGHDVMLLAEAYGQDAAFRAKEQADRGRASMSTQRLFVDNLNPQASAREYAGLMALIAQNGLSDAQSSFMARRYLEWPMVFPVNQELFSNLGYKNGAMPGVLTTLYYAYRSGETTPVVVALFFRDLPNGTYQRWRRNELAHDEFARWLLYDPAAIPALRRVLNGN